MEEGYGECSAKIDRKAAFMLQFKHLRTISEKCLQQGIPMPIAAVFSNKAAAIGKSFDAEDTNRPTCCRRCYFALENPKSFSLRLLKEKKLEGKCLRKIAGRRSGRQRERLLKKLIEEPGTSFTAVCNGCGFSMNCGLLRKKRTEADAKDETSLLMSTSAHDSFLRCQNQSRVPSTPNSSYLNRTSTKSSIYSPLARNRRGSKLQRLLLSERTSTGGASNSLSAFLNSFKV